MPRECHPKTQVTPIVYSSPHRVAVPGDLYQKLAPDRLEPPLDPASAQRRGTLRVSLIPSPAGPRISGWSAKQGVHPCVRFWPLGGQTAELAVSQARRASSAP